MILALLGSLLMQTEPLIEPANGSVTMVYQGRCLKESVIGTGSKRSDLAKGAMPFRCSKAVLTAFPSRDRLLVQFDNSETKAGTIGFAGKRNARTHDVDVDHIYLNDGRTLKADGGFCTLRGSPTHLVSVVCAGRITQGSIAIAADVAFMADDLH